MIGGFQVGAFQPAYQQVRAVQEGGGWYHEPRDYARKRSPEEIQAERERLGILPKSVRKVVRRLAARKVEDVQTVDDGLELLAELKREQAEAELRSALRAEQLRYQANYTTVMLGVIQDAIRRRIQELEDDEASQVLALWLDM